MSEIDAGVSYYVCLSCLIILLVLTIFIYPQIKEGAHRSGAKRKITGAACETVAKCLRARIGLELTSVIINEERTRAGVATVGKNTVRLSAKKGVFGHVSQTAQ